MLDKVSVKPFLSPIRRNDPQALGLILDYPFLERGGTPLDFSGRANNPTKLGSPTWVQREMGPAMDFPTDDDQFEFPDLGIFDGSHPYSIVALIEMDDQPNDRRSNFIIHPRNEYDVWMSYEIQTDGSFTLRFGWWDGSAHNADETDVPAEQWQMAIAVWDTATSTTRLYRNAIERATASTGSPNSVTDFNRIGGRDTGGGNKDGLDGRIAILRVYDRALTVHDVRDITFDPWRLYRPQRRVVGRATAAGNPWYYYASQGAAA